MKRIICMGFLMLILSVGGFASISFTEYHCQDDICGCQVIIFNEYSQYNDTFSQNGTVIVLADSNIPENIEVYNYTSDVGTLESHDYVYNHDSLSEITCINGTYEYDYICKLSVYNSSELYSNATLGPFEDSGICWVGTTTSTTTSTEGTTTSTEGTTTSTEGTTTSTEGTTTSTGGTTTSVAPTSTPTVPGTTLYGYSLPHGNFGTLPGLNGTGGVTAGNGTLKNMPCTGFCIIGLDKEGFQLYAAIMITILVLISIKPFKLGATASAISLLFFNNIMGWTVITGSLMVIFVFVALATWYMEGK